MIGIAGVTAGAMWGGGKGGGGMGMKGLNLALTSVRDYQILSGFHIKFYLSFKV